MNEKRILFLVDFYYPFSSANAICVKHIQKSLLINGYKSDVICYGKENKILIENEYGLVYSVECPLEMGRNFSERPIKFFEKLHNGFIWPLKSIEVIKNFKKRISYLMTNKEYLGVVCTMRPIEAPLSCFKKNFILYELDSISNNSDNLIGIKKIIKYRANNLERIIYKNAGLIIHMRFHNAHYSQKKYRIFKNKTVEADIPSLINRDYKKRNNEDGKLIISYTGALDKITRSPDYAVELFKKINDIIDCEVDFYSKGNCDYIFDDENNKKFVFNKGYIPSEQIFEVFDNSDFLLNIGNNFTGKVTSLPSKTIEYISTGKPIIHIDGGENDTAKDYIRKCTNSIIISPNDDFSTNVDKLLSFIHNNYNKVENREKIEKIFVENTPSFTAEIILNYFRSINGEGDNIEGRK